MTFSTIKSPVINPAAINTTSHLVSGVRDDIFAISDGSDTYHFCGLTRTPNGYRFESRFGLKDYYALDYDYGIGIVPTTPLQWEVVLLNKGEREMSAECCLARVYDRVNSPSVFRRVSKHAYCIDWHYRSDFWSYWSDICNYLQYDSHRNTNAAQILSVLKKWEKASRQTSNWVIRQIDPKKHRAIEIHVARHQWIWYDRTSGVATLGMGEHEWGKTQLFSHVTGVRFNRASPIYHGWLIELTHGERYLLRWNGRDVTAQPLFFPYGEWERRDQWVLWYKDRTMFTPSGQIIIAEPWFKIAGASPKWVFLRPSQDQDDWNAVVESRLRIIEERERWVLFEASGTPENQIKVIDQSGNLHTTTLPFESDEKLEEICVGNQSMLITTRRNNTCMLTIADVSDLPPRLQIRATLFQDDRRYAVHALRSNPDVYAVVFLPYRSAFLKILLVDALGRAWVVPYVFPCAFYSDVYKIAMPKDNHLIVELIDDEGDPTGYRLMIEMENGMGVIRFPDGTTATHKGVELENGSAVLEKCLCQHAPYKRNLLPFRTKVREMKK